MDPSDTFAGNVEVSLDGVPVSVPPQRRSFVAIHAWLESVALSRQRILCWLTVDGEPVNLTHTPRFSVTQFSRVAAESMSLNEVPLQLVKAALQQATLLRTRVQTAVELVLINSPEQARELWWTLAPSLKEPLLTLSLLPETICGPENGRASLTQLRKWQLQQLGKVIADVDSASCDSDTAPVAAALEARVLVWLEQLCDSLELWQDSLALPPITVSFQKA